MSVNKTYRESMVDIAEAYHAEHGSDPATSRDMGQWAIDQGLWEAQQEKVLGIFVRDMAAALQHQTHKAPDGQELRTWWSMKVQKADAQGKEKQLFFWINVTESTIDQVTQAWRQRLDGMGADAISAYRDGKAYNDNYLPKGSPPLQLDFDFNEIVRRDDDNEAGAVA